LNPGGTQIPLKLGQQRRGAVTATTTSTIDRVAPNCIPFGEGRRAVALDWYILEPDAYHEFLTHRRRWFRRARVAREPGAHLAMEEHTHHALLSQCGHLPLLRRAADYYEDAAYAPDEVGGLLAELASVGHVPGAAELEALCRAALRLGSGLVVISD
jgi:hypothetical protein